MAEAPWSPIAVITAALPGGAIAKSTSGLLQAAGADGPVAGAAAVGTSASCCARCRCRCRTARARSRRGRWRGRSSSARWVPMYGVREVAHRLPGQRLPGRRRRRCCGRPRPPATSGRGWRLHHRGRLARIDGQAAAVRPGTGSILHAPARAGRYLPHRAGRASPLGPRLSVYDRYSEPVRGDHPVLRQLAGGCPGRRASSAAAVGGAVQGGGTCRRRRRRFRLAAAGPYVTKRDARILAVPPRPLTGKEETCRRGHAVDRAAPQAVLRVLQQQGCGGRRGRSRAAPRPAAVLVGAQLEGQISALEGAAPVGGAQDRAVARPVVGVGARPR